MAGIFLFRIFAAFSRRRRRRRRRWRRGRSRRSPIGVLEETFLAEVLFSFYYVFVSQAQDFFLRKTVLKRCGQFSQNNSQVLKLGGT